MNRLRVRLGHGHAILLAGVLIALLVGRMSTAAFSAQTDTTGSSFATASIELTDDDAGAALFTLTNMVPGDSASDCITVTYTGGIDPLAVKVFASGAVSGSAALAGFLQVTIEEGAEVLDCSLFTPTSTILTAEALSTFDDRLDYSAGVGTWDPAVSGESRTYRITVALSSSADDTVQGATVSDVGFVWETQSG